MTDAATALKEAFDELATLPQADQEKIARELLEHVEKIRALRADLQAGIDSLDAGRGKEIDIDDVIKRARKLTPRLSWIPSYEAVLFYIQVCYEKTDQANK